MSSQIARNIEKKSKIDTFKVTLQTTSKQKIKEKHNPYTERHPCMHATCKLYTSLYQMGTGICGAISHCNDCH